MASAHASPRLVATLSLLVTAGGSGRVFAQSPLLKDVRFWSSGEITRVAIETTVEVKIYKDRLYQPDRVYVDLQGVRLPGVKPKPVTLPVADGLVKQIRYALTTPTVTRVVVDLEQDAEFAVSQLSGPPRVVIELRVKSPRPPAVISSAPVPPSAKPTTRPFVAPAPPKTAARTLQVVPAEVPVLESRPSLPELRAPVLEARRPLKPFVAPTLRPMPVPKREFRIEEAVPAAPVSMRTTPLPRWMTAELRAAAPPAAGIVAAPEPAVERAARPAQPDRLGNQSLTRALGLKLNRVVLDAGHGGQDHGTTSKSGVVEKDLVLDITLRLGKLIEEKLNAEVLYTREDDRFIPLETRPDIANRNRADLFLSLHANSSPYRYVAGVETYYLSLTTTKADLEVAARENASSEKSIHELSDLLRKIATNEKLVESRDFAGRIQRTAFEYSAQANGGKLRNRGVKKAPFVVLIGAQMPAVLVEIGFLTNPQEEALMKKPEHRQKIAESIFKGVLQYSRTLSHFSLAQRRPAQE